MAVVVKPKKTSGNISKKAVPPKSPSIQDDVQTLTRTGKIRDKRTPKKKVPL